MAALTTGQSLTFNAQLLRGKVTKYAVYGVSGALVTIVIATILVCYIQNGAITLEGIIDAQKGNVALWVLDLMPFLFALWGQHVGAVMAYEAGAMLIDQTSELRARTTELEKQAMYESTHDVLTRLPNRTLLCDRMDQVLMAAHGDKATIAVLVIDLDNFKDINDTFGQYAGDRVLNQVATRLQGTVHEMDTVARIGGDKFAVFLPKLKIVDDATVVAEKLEKALEVAFVHEGIKLDVQASIGISVFPQHGADVDTLLQRADVAMSVAKQEKRGHIVYHPKMDKHSPYRLTLMGELRHAIETDELLLQYQPKVNLRDRRVTEFEAVVRWLHPRHQLLQPNEFIPLAERTGLIKVLTQWVLSRALRQADAWAKTGRDFGIAVNLSAQDLLNPELADLVAGMLAAENMPAERLVLEITETTILLDRKRAMQILEHLADMGVRIAIDDFGTGYSSLSYLSRMPVNEIKIDKSFVMDMIENPRHATIVKATIDLAHNLDIAVVAEGVTDKRTLMRLKELGCDSVQGFYISKPISSNQIDAWLDNWVFPT